MIKYRTRFKKIEAIEVSRETDKCMFYPSPSGREVREAKRSDWQNWHDTWDEAHRFLLDEAEQEEKRAMLSLQAAQEKLENIKAMKKP